MTEPSFIFGTCPICGEGMALDESKVRDYMKVGVLCRPGCDRISYLHDVTGHRFVPHAAGIEACGIAVSGSGHGKALETCMTFRDPACGLITSSYSTAFEHECHDPAKRPQPAPQPARPAEDER